MAATRARNELVCFSCKGEIEGRYVQAIGRNWHPHHFRCAVCAEPIDGEQFYTHEGQPYHQACYRDNVLPRCGYCRRPLEGTWLVDGWGTAFCPFHEEEWPRCEFCNRFVTTGGNSTASIDGRPRCGPCRAVAIEDDAMARVILPPLVDWLQEEGVTLDRSVRFRVEMVGREELQGPDREGPDYLGMAHVTRRSDTREPTRLELNLLRGMPSPLFEGVAIHELGHAWLACREVTGLPSWAEEGFCELLAHRWFTYTDTVESRYYAKRIEANDNAVYGGGYRRLRKLAEAVGFERLIDHLIAHRTLPPVPG